MSRALLDTLCSESGTIFEMVALDGTLDVESLGWELLRPIGMATSCRELTTYI